MHGPGRPRLLRHAMCAAGEDNLRDCVMVVGVGDDSAAGESDVSGWSYHNDERTEKVKQRGSFIMR